MRSLSIVADEDIHNVRETFSAFGKLQLTNGRRISQTLLKTAEVLLVRSITTVNAELLQDTAVRFVGTASSGTDHIDQNYLRTVGIRFAHAPGCNAQAVTEYVLSSLYALATEQGFRLQDKSVGIIGCGQIGNRLATLLHGLGVRCLLNDPPLAARQPQQGYVELAALAQADIISIHAALTVDDIFPSKGLIDGRFLQSLKKDVILINTARGEIVDEEQLLQFKQQCPSVSLILDVWCTEPNINTDLLQASRLATPHIAGYSRRSKQRATVQLATQLHRYSDTGTNIFTPPALPPQRLTVSSVPDAVLRSYDVRMDNLPHTRLPSSGQWFERHRQNYPLRAEFGEHLITCAGLPSYTMQQLAQLGFRLQGI